jgi:hypothetical protein
MIMIKSTQPAKCGIILKDEFTRLNASEIRSVGVHTIVRFNYLCAENCDKIRFLIETNISFTVHFHNFGVLR